MSTMPLVDIIKKIDIALAQKKRVLLALAGPPASGKSTLSSKLVQHYTDQSVILPMDGFHLDNAILQHMGILDRKGSPESFDAAGFISTVRRVRDGEHVFVPQFDRNADFSRACASKIGDHKLVIVEGNYLLFDEPPWRSLATFWDISIWMDLPIEVIEQRCIQRWLDHGLDVQTAQKRAHNNDVANARRIINNRLQSDHLISNK